MMSKFFLRDSPQPSEEQCPCSFILLHTLARMLLIPRSTRPERGTRHPRRDARAPRTVRRPRKTGMKRAGIEDVKDWARSNGLRAGRIIDDMFKAIGEQTVTVPGTGMAETSHPLHRPRHQGHQGPASRDRHAGRGPAGGPPSSHGPDVDARDRRQDRKQHPPRHRRRHRQLQSAAPPWPAYARQSRPVTGQSGTGIKGERPSGRGNKRLKNALWQSSFVASTKHPPSIAYYQRKREQGKHHNAAVIRLARRRCDVIYSMLKNGTLYQEPALVA